MTAILLVIKLNRYLEMLARSRSSSESTFLSAVIQVEPETATTGERGSRLFFFDFFLNFFFFTFFPALDFIFFGDSGTR